VCLFVCLFVIVCVCVCLSVCLFVSALFACWCVFGLFVCSFVCMWLQVTMLLVGTVFVCFRVTHCVVYVFVLHCVLFVCVLPCVCLFPRCVTLLLVCFNIVCSVVCHNVCLFVCLFVGWLVGWCVCLWAFCADIGICPVLFQIYFMNFTGAINAASRRLEIPLVTGSLTIMISDLAFEASSGCGADLPHG